MMQIKDNNVTTYTKTLIFIFAFVFLVPPGQSLAAERESDGYSSQQPCHHNQTASSQATPHKHNKQAGVSSHSNDCVGFCNCAGCGGIFCHAGTVAIYGIGPVVTKKHTTLYSPSFIHSLTGINCPPNKKPPRVII